MTRTSRRLLWLLAALFVVVLLTTAALQISVLSKQLRNTQSNRAAVDFVNASTRDFITLRAPPQHEIVRFTGEVKTQHQLGGGHAWAQEGTNSGHSYYLRSGVIEPFKVRSLDGPLSLEVLARAFSADVRASAPDKWAEPSYMGRDSSEGPLPSAVAHVPHACGGLSLFFSRTSETECEVYVTIVLSSGPIPWLITSTGMHPTGFTPAK